MTPLVLASTSPYRRELLARFRLPFTVDRPDVDESPLPGEAPLALATRLATAKARAVAARHPAAVVIGSDQVAEIDGRTLGKPGTRERALAQLMAASGRSVAFHTAFSVVEPGGGTRDHVDLTRVRFRTFDEDAAGRYLDAEQPYDCAGAFKCEGLGIVLFESIRSDDPTALVGLPLIALAGALRAAGYRLP